MRPYSRYAPSTVPENPLRPSHWEVKQLKYLITPVAGYKAGPFGSALITAKLNDTGEVAVLTPENVTNGLNPAEFTMFLPEARIIEMKAFEVLPQDVVFPIGGTLGRAAVMPTGCRGILHQRLARIRTNPHLLVPEFLKLLMSEYAGFKSLDELERRGAILHHITREQLLDRRIAVPPVPEQREILRFVDVETSKVDVLIAKQEYLISTLREDRTATITHAVTKGIDPQVALKDSDVEWLGSVPRHWDVRQLKWGSPVRRGASPRPIDDPIYFDDEGHWSWVRIADVSASGGHLHQTTQRLSELGSSLSVKLEPGSLFVSIAGTVGKPCITHIPACIHDGFVYFPTLDLLPAFLFRVFESGECYRGLGKLGTQLNLNTDTIGSIRMPVPPISEQKRIVAEIDVRCAKLDALIAKASEVISMLQEYRSALITAAVTGKIDVRGAA